MANRRMLSKSISTSLKLSRLSEFAQLLFTWMIPHSDDFGRLDGEQEVIKALIMPFSKRKPEDFGKALLEMSAQGVIRWYKTEQKAVIEIVNSDFHQSNLIHKRTSSIFPDFTDKSVEFLHVPGSSRKFPEVPGNSALTELNLTKPNLTLLRSNSLSEGGFLKFWEAYPKRVSKGRAEKAWKALNPNEQLVCKILQAIERAKTSESWRKEAGRYIPHPATWLNAKGWEDDLETDFAKANSIESWLSEQKEHA